MKLDPHDHGRSKLWVFQRLLMSLVAIVVIYGNCAILFNKVMSHSFERLALPIHPRLHDAFITFPVFSYYQDFNRDIVIKGLLEGTTDTWIDLDVDDYFPFRMGEMHQRVFVGRVYYAGPEARAAAWKMMTRKIRERHNRLHPEERISKVSLRTETWPRSIKGYRAEKTPDKTNVLTIYTEGSE